MTEEKTKRTTAATGMIDHLATVEVEIETVAIVEIVTIVETVTIVEIVAVVATVVRVGTEIAETMTVGDEIMTAATAETDKETLVAENDTGATAMIVMLAMAVDVTATTVDAVVIADETMMITETHVGTAGTALTILEDGTVTTDTAMRAETDGTVETADGAEIGATTEIHTTEADKVVLTDTMTAANETAKTEGVMTLEIGPAAETDKMTATAPETWEVRWRCCAKC